MASLPLATHSFPYTSRRDHHHHRQTLSSCRQQIQISTGNSLLLNRVRCCAVITTGVDKRRSADYGPPVWKYDFIQSLSSIYKGEAYEKKAKLLKEEVIMMLENKKVKDPLEQLEIIDMVQRLGVSYHFEAMIESMLNNIYNHTDWNGETDLHGVALRFRLLRQQGYNDVPQGVFDKFKDKNGNFKESLCRNTKGLLSMYEASFHLLEGESILDEARDFTTKHLKENLETISIDPYLAMLVSHALELPLHWTMQRFEARWFIDAYGMQEHAINNHALLDFAKLDFNMVQAIHQEELKHVSRWWEDLEWNKKLPFARDRLVECYLWTMGGLYNPRSDYSKYRRLVTRVVQLVTSIDDVYDIYATLDELELFTDAIHRWDVNLLEQMPEYLKICFLGNFNCVNELAYKVLQKGGLNPIPYFKKTWADLCGLYLKEARWFHSGHVPTLEEYLNIGWITISIPMVSAHRYFLTPNDDTSPNITKAGLDAIENYHDLIKWPSMVVRLANDLQTSKNEMERGDTMKSMQLYMRERGISMDDARDHVKELIRDAWKKINTNRVAPNCPFSKQFVDVSINQARIAQFIYQYGDGIGHEIGGDFKNRVALLLVEPISLSFN